MFRQGDKVVDIDTSATPGFKGKKADAVDVADRAQQDDSPNCRRCCTPTARRGGDNRSVLLVLQGMDTAGKGGIVKHVVGAANPQGIRYTAFGVPTEEERKHHYLWRIRRALPPAGHIGVFDRSHYEDVLVVRVHNIVPPEVWGKRYDEINKFEKKLVDSGTTIIKVAMFVSLGRAEEATARTARAAGQVLEVQPEGHRRAAAVAGVPGGLSGHARADVDRLRAVARRAVRPKWYSRLAITRAAHRGTQALNLSWPPADFDITAEKKRLAEA